MPRSASDLVRSVRAGLAGLADPGRAARMQAYTRSEMPFHGVPMPAVRTLCRDLYADPLTTEAQWRAAVLELWDDASYREERYAATALAGHPAYARWRGPPVLDLYRHLIVTGAWWDHVDAVSGLVADVLLAHRHAVTPVLRAWAVADDLWLRRSAIISQLGHGASVDRDLLSFAIESNLDGSTRTTPARSAYGGEFFVRKAIGWALRDLARTDPGWVTAYVREHEADLSGLSRREALKHL